jgi:membrane dipeptidase
MLFLVVYDSSAWRSAGEPFGDGGGGVLSSGQIHVTGGGMIRLGLVSFLLAGGLATAQVSPDAAKLHADALVFDGHVHIGTRQFYRGGDIGQRYPDGQVDLPRAREGGVDALMFTLYVREEYYPQRFETKQALRLIDFAREQIRRNHETVELALTADDIERINDAGKIAAILDIEGGFDLDGDLGVLRSLHRLGLRCFQLPAHNWANNFADSCCAPHKWGGLTDQGRAVIWEANRLGMLINVSHASDETIEQALEVSAQPIVATHHGMRSVNDIPRNMPDELMKKLAAKGGVIGFQIGNSFHNPRYFEWRTQQAGKPFWDTNDVAGDRGRDIAAIDRMIAPGFPFVGPEAPADVILSVDEWVGVVDRAIELVGEDHVSLGTDFDGGPTPPRGIRDIGDLALIADAMLRRGYSEQRIRKFLGGNLLRVFRQVTQ